MSNKQNAQNSTQDTVVGVFLDPQHAQKAIDELQSAGINAQLADKSALQAFKNAGLDQEVAQLYEGRMNEGNTIVLANAKGKGVQALDTMMNCGAEYMNLNTTEQWNNTGSTVNKGQTMTAGDYRNLDKSKRQYGRYDQTKGRANTPEEMRVQLRTETMTPVKQSVQTGEAQIHKVVHESQQEVPVTLRHEEVYVDRKAVDRPATAGEITDVKDEVISVPVYEERAELQKQTRVHEEVGIGKRTTEEQKTLTGTTRREDIEVTNDGNVRVTGNQGKNVNTSNQTQNARDMQDTDTSQYENRS
jgi:uncharacterized protein (TIGR02271 family)